MGIGHARWWVLVALLSLLFELVQGPKPMGAWWAQASVSEGRSPDRQTPSSVAALAVEDGEEGDDGEDGEPDAQPGEDPDSRPGEPSGEEGDEEPGKKASDAVCLSDSLLYAFLGQQSGLLGIGHAAVLRDLTDRETLERPPRAA